MKTFSLAAAVAATLIFSSCAQASVIFTEGFDGLANNAFAFPTEDANDAGLIIGGSSQPAANGGGAGTVRTGANTAAFAAGSIEPAGTLTFTVSQRVRDREGFAGLVDASGNRVLYIGNTNGADSVNNAEDPGEFRVYGLGDTLVAPVTGGNVGGEGFDATNGISSTSFWYALQIEVDTLSGEGIFRSSFLGADVIPVPPGSFVDLGTFTLDAATVAALGSVTGINAGQSGGGVAVDDFVVEFAAVPEPASACLLALGLAGAVARRRRS